MNTFVNAEQAGKFEMYQLDDGDIEVVSGGLPAIAAAAAAVALGGAALDLGYKLGGMMYKALH